MLRDSRERVSVSRDGRSRQTRGRRCGPRLMVVRRQRPAAHRAPPPRVRSAFCVSILRHLVPGRTHSCCNSLLTLLEAGGPPLTSQFWGSTWASGRDCSSPDLCGGGSGLCSLKAPLQWQCRLGSSEPSEVAGVCWYLPMGPAQEEPLSRPPSRQVDPPLPSQRWYSTCASGRHCSSPGTCWRRSGGASLWTGLLSLRGLQSTEPGKITRLPGLRLTPPLFAALGLHEGMSQPLLVTRSVKEKVWANLPEDGTSLAAAAGKFRAVEIRSFLLVLSMGL